ncbi:Mobile element protein [Desulfurella amilsii]|uniref:Mobile element protein n=1 Tax=Desulfurella amilsii TaxID=1562698 RepID=A0A1X4XY96_9BACT|nr:IS3 family transposase [Desulfurella amilsii]OSS42516.1 Mobile element protein [Desulfurella amilsii]
MSTKKRNYSNEFKTKIVLELLENDITINELASKYNVLPKSIQQWKKRFLENAHLVFEEAVPVKKFREKINEDARIIEDLQKALGKATIERDWILKKVKSLGSNNKSLVDPKLKIISITRQSELIGINRSALYYKKRNMAFESDKILMAKIADIYSQYPFYGFRKISYTLKQEDLNIGKKKIKTLMKKLNIQAIYPMKKKFTTIPTKEHKKYPYLLKEKEAISKPNKVWASDITYLKLKSGFVYLCAIIDWRTRAILSYKISNTIDTKLVSDTLNNAILCYGKPDIFNTDQGTQYTAFNFTAILSSLNIEISMDSKGRAYDNIIVERFWRSLKYENVYLANYNTIKEAKEGIKDYIYFYNYKRPHESLGYKTPMSVYMAGTEQWA